MDLRYRNRSPLGVLRPFWLGARFSQSSGIDDASLSAGSESMIWFLRAQEEGALITVLPEVQMSRRMHTTNCSRMNPLESFFPILKEWRDYQRRSHRR